MKKSEHVMPYKKWMDAMDLDVMEEVFYELCVECEVGVTQQKTY